MNKSAINPGQRTDGRGRTAGSDIVSISERGKPGTLNERMLNVRLDPDTDAKLMRLTNGRSQAAFLRQLVNYEYFRVYKTDEVQS